MMIITYRVLIPINILSINTNDEMTPRNDTNLLYVTKGKRSYSHNIKVWLNSRVNDIYKWAINRSTQINMKRKFLQRMAWAKNIADSSQSHPRGRRSSDYLIGFSVVAMLADQKEKIKINKQRKTFFDTDAEQIGIDNRCSACISHRIEDFIGNPIPTKRSIKGFGGARVANIMSGTIAWNWCDEMGKVHKFQIPNSYYVPEGGVRLLSPQHWAQEQRKITKSRQSPYGCDTTHNRSTLYWKGGNKLMVPIDPTNNVSTFNLAPGYNKFKLFCEKAEIEYEEECKAPIICQPAEDESDIESVNEEMATDENDSWPEG